MGLNLQILSDLHIEFHKDWGRSLIDSLDSSGVDILIVAGDMVPLKDYHRAEAIFKEFCDKYPIVLYVVGNHEFYGSNRPQVEQALDSLRKKFSNLHAFFTPGEVNIQGQNFICGPMWYPYKPMCDVYENNMNDCAMIRGFKSWVYEENRLFMELLDKVTPDDVVVTHYLPAERSIYKKYKGSSLNMFFLCDVEKEILVKQPKLWVHGHTHEPCNYMIGTTNVVCNPLGYPNEVKASFNDKLIIKV